ncbi:hypothetical protein [Pseudomonas viridiflava]|uniref:hypothetical protein n=1 Tax=Pseudomonas viridiflava TaxID=33069 RepID=UPI0013CEFB23|nr:hypothetical protein [Pseudomonas viridiflava]
MKAKPGQPVIPLASPHITNHLNWRVGKLNQDNIDTHFSCHCTTATSAKTREKLTATQRRIRVSFGKLQQIVSTPATQALARTRIETD